MSSSSSSGTSNSIFIQADAKTKHALAHDLSRAVIKSVMSLSDSSNALNVSGNGAKGAGASSSASGKSLSDPRTQAPRKRRGGDTILRRVVTAAHSPMLACGESLRARRPRNRRTTSPSLNVSTALPQVVRLSHTERGPGTRPVRATITHERQPYHCTVTTQTRNRSTFGSAVIPAGVLECTSTSLMPVYSVTGLPLLTSSRVRGGIVSPFASAVLSPCVAMLNDDMRKYIQPTPVSRFNPEPRLPLQSPSKVTILNVLLWHHFCFYKRRKTLLVASIVFPIALMGFIIFGLTRIFHITKSIQEFKPCIPEPESMLSAGPWLYVLRHGLMDCKPIPQRILSIQRNCDPLPYKPTEDYPDLRWLTNDTQVCPEGWGIYRPISVCIYRTSWQANILMGNIAFYPKSNSSVAIMKMVEEKLQSYLDFFDLGLNTTAPSARYSSSNAEAILLETLASDLNANINNMSCLRPAKNRILGVSTLEDALSFFQNQKPLPSFMGILHFLKLPSNSSRGDIDYELIYDKLNPLGLQDPGILLLQGLVEESIISHYSDVPQAQLWDIRVRGLPEKCWDLLHSTMFNVLTYVIPPVIVWAFILVPIYATDQMIVEKTLGLREYIGLMGASNCMIKFSWWLFYSLFLLPLSGIVSLMVRFWLGHILIHTSFVSIFSLIAMFNNAQLSLGFMLSSILNSTKQTSNIFCALHSILWLLVTFLLTDLRTVNSALAIGAHILSLYCVVPMLIGWKYLFTWEKHWLTMNTKLLFESPVPTDDFGGFGACIIWLAIDGLLYLLLAAYIEKVFPGEFGISSHPLFFLGYSNCGSEKDRSGDQSGSAGNEADENGSRANVETINESLSTGLETQGLRKVYPNGYVALHGLSIAFYASEVTCLLGQNGAGKSTAINSIVGMIDPSKGRILFNGIEQASKTSLGTNTGIGFVPQHDILYPALTVNEHLLFYGGIFGMTKRETMDTASVLLNDLGINATDLNTMAEDLSGGQKRKLSIALAYMSTPSIVIMDEPTSGVDPFGRRAMWDLILKYRCRTTTILSTHQMHEADVLSDRIAVISGGRLSCYGTPLYLKQNYGKGSQVTVVMPKHTIESTDSSKVINCFIRQYFNNVTFKRHDKYEYSFTVSTEESRSEKLVQFLEKFDNERIKLGYESYGVSESTMEQVFFAASGYNFDKTKTEHEVPHASINASESHFSYNKISWGPSRWLLQASGVLLKQAIYSLRSFSFLIYQFLLPLLFVVLLILITGPSSRGSSNDSNIVHLWNGNRQNLLFYRKLHLIPIVENTTTNHPPSSSIISALLHRGLGPRCTTLGVPGYRCKAISNTPPDTDLSTYSDSAAPLHISACVNQSCGRSCTDNSYLRSYPGQMLPSFDRVFKLDGSLDLWSWIFAANDSSREVIGGYDFVEDVDQNRIKVYLASLISNDSLKPVLSQLMSSTVKPRQVTIWTKPSLRYAMLNGFNNLVLRSYTNVSQGAAIRLRLRAVPFYPSSKVPKEEVNFFKLFLSIPFLVLAFMFTSYSVAYLIMHEKSTGLKRLQRIASVSGPIYWMANLICDFAAFCVSLGLISLLLWLTPNPFQSNVGILICSMIPYGFATITFIYMLSFWFETDTAVTQMINMSTLILMIAASLLGGFAFVYKGCIKSSERKCSYYKWAPPVNDVLRFLPGYYLTDAILSIILTDPSGPIARYDSPTVETRIESMLQIIIQGIVAGIFYFIVVLILERFNVDCTCSCDCSCCCRSRNRPTRAYDLGNQDPDVVAEEAKAMSQPLGTDVLEVRQLKKLYPGTGAPAVNGVSFTVPESQCFGLLGINGAGKSTTFKLLTGFLSPSAGSALIGGNNLYRCGKAYSCSFGYCPQENTLFDMLTVKQHLEIFTRLRGVPGSARPALIESLIAQVDLTEYVKKKAKQLSGGNKRKLQVALSLIDYPPLIFMDEPTTGMDPGARRMVWDAITRATRHKSAVVLTSHIMEECEALCNRLVIMACGQFHCIGGVQYLKNKYGNQYIVKLRLKPPAGASTEPEGTKVLADRHQARSEQVTLIKNTIISEYPSARLIEEHTTLIQYNIPTENLKLAKLFRKLYDMRTQHHYLDDYSISQVSLEHVFVEMAQKQELMMANQENWSKYISR